MIKLRDGLLDWIVKMAVNRRKTVYISAVLITLVLGALSGNLVLDTRWTELLPEDLPVVKEYRKLEKNFYQPQNMIVAISGKDSAALEDITDEVTLTLKKNMVCHSGDPEDCRKDERYAKYVYGSLPKEWMKKNSLKLAKPRDAGRMQRMFSSPELHGFIKKMNDDFEREYTDADDVKKKERETVGFLDAVESLISEIKNAAENDFSEKNTTRVVRDLTGGNPYTMSLDRTMSLVMVASAFPEDDANIMPLVDRRVENILRPLQLKYPEYNIERTGMTAIGRDEMDSVGPYTIAITLAAFVMIYLLLAWNFRSFVVPLMNLVPIVAGIVWTMGIIQLVFGSINLITSMIMVVLLGLGIDFTIHISTRFNEESSKGNDISDALHKTIAGTGKGVTTGAVTTAVAFLAIMIADAKAVREFGFCAGTGVLLTLVASLVILPALLASREERVRKKKGVSRARGFAVLGSLVETVSFRKRITVPVFVILLFAGFIAGYNLEWEWNFLNLEPEGLRSVELQDEIIEKYRLSVSTAFVTASSVDESRKLRERLKEKNVVGDVSDISRWVSRSDYRESLSHIKKLASNLNRNFIPDNYYNSIKLESLKRELKRLSYNMIEMQALSFTGGQDRVYDKTVRIVGTRDSREKGILLQLEKTLMGDDLALKELNSFSKLFTGNMVQRLREMVKDTSSVTEDMIPEDILAQFKGKKKDAGYLVTIMPVKNLYSKAELENFQSVVNSIHKGVTGFPQLVLHMNLSTLEEGRIAMLAAIIVILLVLLVDFKKPLVSFLTLIPLVTGLSLTLGAMWLLGEKLNYINMIALPVIIGIGVDDGVHFIHRYMDEGRGRLKEAASSVGHAMLMTSLTTMIGFGSLMFYLMRGMASMGLVLFLGVGLCFIVTVTLLPALVSIFEGRIFSKDEQ